MLAFGALPAIAQMLGFILLPLSPTWLVLMGRKDEAEQVLRRIRMLPKEHSDDNGEESEEEDEVTRELKEIIEEHEQAQKGKHVGLFELWRSYPQVRRTMMLGCSLWIVSQLAGEII
jgi:2-keto-3-deoxy-L-rhamnonate aldolase RhmA